MSTEIERENMFICNTCGTETENDSNFPYCGKECEAEAEAEEAAYEAACEADSEAAMIIDMQYKG